MPRRSAPNATSSPTSRGFTTAAVGTQHSVTDAPTKSTTVTNSQPGSVRKTIKSAVRNHRSSLERRHPVNLNATVSSPAPAVLPMQPSRQHQPSPRNHQRPTPVEAPSGRKTFSLRHGEARKALWPMSHSNLCGCAALASQRWRLGSVGFTVGGMGAWWWRCGGVLVGSELASDPLLA